MFRLKEKKDDQAILQSKANFCTFFPPVKDLHTIQ